MDLDPQTIEGYRLKLRYKVCYHLGRVCPDVDDVVQETLTRFLQALKDDKIRNPDSLGAFLSGICNNVVAEYRRRLWREVPGEVPPAHTPLVPPEADLLELQDAIAAALGEMPPRDREIMHAFYLQEKDKGEICRSTGISEGQFRVALFRAKERFRKIYRQRVKHASPGAH
jgi:RNA polymerase sigma-70 factor (ECF subfamily)